MNSTALLKLILSRNGAFAPSCRNGLLQPMRQAGLKVTDTDLLTVKEVAELKGCSEQYVRSLISQDRIEHHEDDSPGNHRRQWLIPLNALDPKLQAKHLGKKHPKKLSISMPTAPAEKKSLDSYSASERREIDNWIAIIQDWLRCRYKQDKPAADAAFIAHMAVEQPNLKLSPDILYRHWRAWRDQDYDGLIDKRGTARKGKSSIDETVWQAFLSFYLDQAQHPIESCYQYTTLWTRQSRPELLPLPSYHSFYRRIQSDIPEPLKVLGREGQKAYDDRCAPYIRRLYDDMESNDYWVADNHTFDIITASDDHTAHRLYLTAFFDARAGIFTGCTVTNNPCSDATLYALRKGILRYGIPKNIYVDNGREFLTHDVGGLGHRQKKSTAGLSEPPGVFKRLGITMINAQVRNAKAKIIERRFLDVKNQLSRLFETFTGGNVVEKPERLKDVLRAGHIPTDHELVMAVEDALTYYFNEQPYGGSVAADKGKPRIEVYQEHLYAKRTATEEDLNLMMMRSSRMQQVGRRGVHLTISGYRLDYWNDALLASEYFGKKVYIRYDPEDLTSVRLYDTEDRFVMTVPVDNDAVSTYGSGKDELTMARKKVGRVQRAAKIALDNSMLAACDRITALDLILSDAQGKKAARLADPGEECPVLEIHRVNEQPLLREGNGADIPLDTMVRNAERRQNNKDR